MFCSSNNAVDQAGSRKQNQLWGEIICKRCTARTDAEVVHLSTSFRDPFFKSLCDQIITKDIASMIELNV